MTMPPCLKRCLPPTLLGLLAAASLAGCATEPAGEGTPKSVDLSGDWTLNLNLSDDPDRPADTEAPPALAPDSGPPRGLGRPGGIGGPNGPPEDPGSPQSGASLLNRGAALAGQPVNAVAQPVSLQSETATETALGSRWTDSAVASEQSSAEAGGTSPTAGPGPVPLSKKAAKSAAVRKLLDAPQRLSIRQSGAVLTVTSTLADGTSSSETYTAGTHTTIQLPPDDSAERDAAWRGPVFVVTTKAKHAGWRETDYALDEDGRLIVSIQTHGGRVGKFDFKRVYDRVKSAS